MTWHKAVRAWIYVRCVLVTNWRYKVKAISSRDVKSQVALSWLAGIIDGEGNIDFSTKVRTTTAGNQFTYFSPKLRITNTDVRMIRRVSEIYKRHKLVFFYAQNSVKRYKNKKKTWRNQLEITVSAQRSVIYLLQLVLPYLANKKRMAGIMIRALRFVQSQPHRGGLGQSKFNYCDDPRFKGYIQAMKSERRWHIDPSTLKCEARATLNWAPQRYRPSTS
jgi:hypothetical protein